MVSKVIIEYTADITMEVTSVRHEDVTCEGCWGATTFLIVNGKCVLSLDDEVYYHEVDLTPEEQCAVLADPNDYLMGCDIDLDSLLEEVRNSLMAAYHLHSDVARRHYATACAKALIDYASQQPTP